MGASIGCLTDVRAWLRFGFGSRGNLIVYDDCLVFASVRHPFLNSALNIPELLNPKSRQSRFDRLAREQALAAPDELAARDRHNWIMRREDVARAAIGKRRSGGGSAGADDVVSLVLGAVSAAGATTEQTLMIHRAGAKISKYPAVTGVWGAEENDLLTRALGDKLARR